MTTSNIKEVHSPLRNLKKRAKTTDTLQNENKNPPQRTDGGTSRVIRRSTFNYARVLEMARINLCIVKARSENANATTEALIEAAEEYAKADGVLDEAALEKMREKLRTNFEIRQDVAYWADGVEKMEAGIAVQKANNEFLDRKPNMAA